MHTELPNFFTPLVELVDDPTQLEQRISSRIIAGKIVKVVDQVNMLRQERKPGAGHNFAKARMQEVRLRVVGRFPIKIKIGQLEACNDHQ